MPRTKYTYAVEHLDNINILYWCRVRWLLPEQQIIARRRRANGDRTCGYMALLRGAAGYGFSIAEAVADALHTWNESSCDDVFPPVGKRDIVVDTNGVIVPPADPIFPR